MSMKKKDIFLIVSGIIFALAFVGTVWFVSNRMTFLLNSDDSSELILGRLLANENRLISKSWYYSTELRVVNTQIFYAFFFKIFHSWHDVRIASCCCLYIVMIAAYYFACKHLKIRRYFLITAALLMIPFSEEYFSIVLKGAYYIPHISITFFTLGLCEAYIADENEKRCNVCLLLALLISILAGMGGARQVAILYMPLMLAAISLAILKASIANGKIICKLERADKKYIIFSAVSFIGACIGYIINIKVLAEIYSFKQWDSISLTWFDIPKIKEVIAGFLLCYGYKGRASGEELFCIFLCMCWFFLTFGACVHILKNRENAEPAHYRMALFTVAAFVIITLLHMFTDMPYLTRYNLPIIILSIPMIAILFKNTGLKESINYAAITMFVLLVSYSGFLFYKEEYKVDNTVELRNIASALQNDEYTEGYATFWKANVLTELSNGVIDVWDWQDSGNKGITVASIDHTYKWLQLKEHDYTHPDGKVFLLFSNKEWKNNPWIGKLSTEHIIYQSDRYIVIGYENYEKLRDDII